MIKNSSVMRSSSNRDGNELTAYSRLDLEPAIPKQLAVVGKGMLNNNTLLNQVLRAHVQRWYPWSRLIASNPQPNAFIGWGRKKSFKRASKAARRSHVPVLSIEDGFVRSLDSGISSKYGMSVVVDDLGIYFDLAKPSRLEQFILQNCDKWSSLPSQSAQSMMTKLCDNNLSKYNNTTYCPELNSLLSSATNARPAPTSSCYHVLLIDQTYGDASIEGAGADAKQFEKMLKIACRTHPQAAIWIKAHPAGKQGYLTALKLPKNVKLLTEVLNPIALLKQVEHVYTVSSHMGFEALMLGKQVHCFGVNWYSGWGLTDDSHAPKKLLQKVQKRRLKTKSVPSKNLKERFGFKRLNNTSANATATVEQLFYAAYIQYSRYVDPATRQACDLNTVMNWLVTNRHWQDKLAGPLTVFEFSRWKLPFVKDFVNFPQTELFVKPKPRLKNLLHPDHFRMDYHSPALVWGLAKRQQLQNKLQQRGITVPTIYCMEDGFIRSNGLGATLLAPLSVVIDKQGIYYDATQPSDLEQLLGTCANLSTEQQARVQRLWQQLLTQRVSKYNVGTANSNNGINTEVMANKRRLLIVGQVEDDLSVQYCGSLIKSNSALIERVREDYPEAYLIYKPHPDVEAGLRAGIVDKHTLKLVDSVAYEMAMPDCLEAVDEVHTISSLTGFEALLRGLEVVCYGLPFYAGWGLTHDIDAHLAPKSDFLRRRHRDTPLTIEQLIYCTLICYPIYRLPEGYGLAQPEQVIDYLYPSKDGHNPVKYSNISHSTNNTKSSFVASLTSNVLSPAKRQANTRFMQLRHRWQQLHKNQR